MTTLVAPVKTDHLLPAAPEHLHQDATEWLSDLEFCRTELSFLIKLLDKTFLRVRGTQRLDDLSILEKKVRALRAKPLKQLHDAVILHEQHLASLDLDEFSLNRQSIVEEHAKHELGVTAFMRTIKKIKKEIFDFVEAEIKTSSKK